MNEPSDEGVDDPRVETVCDGGRRVELCDEQQAFRVDLGELGRAVLETLRSERVPAAHIEAAVVDDRRIHEVNRRFLEHDYPTDVISFCYATEPLEGELIISAERAAMVAREENSSMRLELLWYAVHGTLHLLGYDDRSPVDRAAMRSRERDILRRLGCELPLSVDSALRSDGRRMRRENDLPEGDVT